MFHFSTYRPSSFKDKLLDARHKERCRLLSKPLTNDWLHFS